jgi:hypothetical protein
MTKYGSTSSADKDIKEDIFKSPLHEILKTVAGVAGNTLEVK